MIPIPNVYGNHTDTCINGYTHRFGVPVLALSLTCVDPVFDLC